MQHIHEHEFYTWNTHTEDIKVPKDLRDIKVPKDLRDIKVPKDIKDCIPPQTRPLHLVLTAVSLVI